jgi:hypothetical protein
MERGKLPGNVCFFRNCRQDLADCPATGSNPVAASNKINPSTLQLEFEGLLKVDPELRRTDQGVRRNYLIRFLVSATILLP